MPGDPRIESYDWRGEPQPLLRFGPSEGPTIVAALPLLEEHNRTRAFLVTILRALAARGIGSILPDLPGTGESSIPLATLGLIDLQDAYHAAVEQACAGAPAHALGIRSGALLDPLALLAGRWYLAPQAGAHLLREWARIDGHRADEALWWANEDPVVIAGNIVSHQLLAELAPALPFDHPSLPHRTVRLKTDPAPADHKVEGTPLWRRSEPDNNSALAQSLADDIADWLATCVA